MEVLGKLSQATESKSEGVNDKMREILPLITKILHDERGYIDPGAGSMVIQILMASSIGALFMLRMQLKRFYNAIRNRRKSDKEQS